MGATSLVQAAAVDTTFGPDNSVLFAPINSVRAGETLDYVFVLVPTARCDAGWHQYIPLLKANHVTLNKTPRCYQKQLALPLRSYSFLNCFRAKPRWHPYPCSELVSRVNEF